MTRWEWSNLVLSAKGPTSPTVRLVLLALLTFVNSKTGQAWPSTLKIAERSGHCERTVREALVDAEGAGWLVRDARPGHVTLYSPAIEGNPISLTPEPTADLPRQTAPQPRQQMPDTPAANAYEPRKEPGEESRRRKEGEPPACPLCSAAMKTEKPRRQGIPAFWGCTRYRSTGCKGKRELWDAADVSTTRVPALSEAQTEALSRLRHEATAQQPEPWRASLAAGPPQRRDPRADPRRGDVLEAGGTARRVTGHSEGRVSWVVVGMKDEAHDCALNQWQRWARGAEVRAHGFAPAVSPTAYGST